MIPDIVHGVHRTTDAYYMDLENSILPGFDIQQLKGVTRLRNKQWMRAIEENIGARFFSLEYYETMCTYIKWVKAGGGDEWFVD